MLTTYARRVFHPLLAWVALLMLSVPLAAAPVKITISPTTWSMTTAQTKQFTATVTNTSNTAVTWTATNGTVSTAGLYSPPATAGTYTVAATSVADASKKALATVTVTVPAISVGVSPSSVTLGPGASQTFAATVSGTTNTAVNWTSTGGSITPAGVYTAPATVGTYTVKATSQADGVTSGTATVTLSPMITIFPAAATIPMSTPDVPSQLILTATIAGMTDQRVVWSRSGGNITNSNNAATATFLAPQTAGTYTVTAKSYADRKVVATATITVAAVAPFIGSYTITTAAGAIARTDGIPVPVTGGQQISHDSQIAGGREIWYSNWLGLYLWGNPVSHETTAVLDVSAKSIVPYSIRTVGQFGDSSATVYLEVHPRGKITSLLPDHWTGNLGDTFWVTPVFSGTGKATWGGTTVDVQTGVAFPVVLTQDGLFLTLQAFSDMGVAGDSKSITLYVADRGRFIYLGKAGFSDAKGLVALPETLGQVWLGLHGQAAGFRPFDVASGTLGGTPTPFGGNTQVNLATVNDVEGPFWLDDGRILMFGMDRSTIGVYDPSTRRALFAVRAPWSAAVPTGIRGAIVPLGSGRFWVLGPNGSASIFDIRTSAFSSALATGQARLDPDLTVLADGRVLVSGGQIAGTPALSAMLFNPLTNTLTPTGSMQKARFRHKGILLANGKVLISGGIAWWDTALELYDPASGTFTAAGFALINRQAHNLTQLSDGRVLISSGVSPADGTSVVGSEFYTPSSGMVTRGPYLQKDLVNNQAGPYTLAVPLANGKVLITGGTSTQSTDDVFLFDPQPLLQVQPALGRIFPDQQLAFTTNEPVTWIVREGAVGGGVDGAGNYTPLATPGTYHVVATSTADTTRSSTAIVTVLPKPQALISSFTASATTVSAGTSVTLTPVFSGGTGSIPSIGAVASGTSYTVTPTGTTTYVLSVVDANGLMVSASLTVHVTPVILSFTASANVVAPGNWLTLSWTSAGATYARISDGGEPMIADTSGSISLLPAATATYTLSISSPDGSVSRSLTVVVSVVQSISINPTSVTLHIGQTMTFGSSIASSGSSAMAWSATGGVLLPIGGQAAYTAPSTPGTYLVTVASVADPTRTASCTVTVNPLRATLTPSPAALAISCGAKGNLGCSVQLDGLGDTSVTWEAASGSIQSTGPNQAEFTAPSTPGTVLVTIRSTADSSATVTVPVTVTPVAITITPSIMSLAPGEVVQFGGSIQIVGAGTTDVFWTATEGLINPVGPLSARYVAPLNPGTYQVTVTSKLDPNALATALCTVDESRAPNLTVSPGSPWLPTGGQQAFVAKFGGEVVSTVSWSVEDPSQGSIDSTGLYTAPATPGNYQVTATDNSRGFTATANVSVGVLSILPVQGLVLPGMTLQISAIAGASTVPGNLIWEIQEGPPGGSIDGTGLYTAPQKPGIYHVRATSDQGTGLALITVGLIESVIFTPTLQVSEAGDFVVKITVAGSNAKQLQWSQPFHLEVGAAQPELTVPAEKIRQEIGVDGPYLLKKVEVEDMEDSHVASEAENLGQTQAYPLAALQKPWVVVHPEFTTLGVDLNGNGLLDQLQVTLTVDVVAEGNYSFMANLTDQAFHEVADVATLPTLLKAGANQVTLAFDGRQIRSRGIEGPYLLSGLMLSGPLSATGPDIGPIAFTLNQFEPPASPPPVSSKAAGVLPKSTQPKSKHSRRPSR